MHRTVTADRGKATVQENVLGVIIRFPALASYATETQACRKVGPLTEVLASNGLLIAVHATMSGAPDADYMVTGWNKLLVPLENRSPHAGATPRTFPTKLKLSRRIGVRHHRFAGQPVGLQTGSEPQSKATTENVKRRSCWDHAQLGRDYRVVCLEAQPGQHPGRFRSSPESSCLVSKTLSTRALSLKKIFLHKNLPWNFRKLKQNSSST